MHGKVAFALFSSAVLVLLAFASLASADLSFCPPGSGASQCSSPQGVAVDRESGRLYVADAGNNRVGVFNADRSFAFAFGWGVADGGAELQSCGPEATPPTVSCQKGLEGGGAGEFSGLTDIAVDNDSGSSSFHDIYALDGKRVQKFDSEGEFILTFGGGVITGGAAGTGNLALGLKEITGVQTTKKRFYVGQTITGAGIPAETKIIALGPNTITLSKAATASGTGVALSVAEGPGNKPTNEVDTLINLGTGSPNFAFTTPDPSPSKSELGQLPNNTTGPQLQKALEDLPNIGAGNVKVIGENVNGEEHDYTVEFTGALADTDVTLQPANSLGNRQVVSLQNGGGGFEICTAAIAVSCSGGIEGTGEGQIDDSPHLAVGPGGTVHVADCVRVSSVSASKCENRLQKFDSAGAFVEELALTQSQFQPEGVAVDSGGDFYVSVNDAIFKYGAAGNLLGQLPIGTAAAALAVDATDNLYAAESEKSQGGLVIAEYGPALNTLRRFGYGTLKSQPNGLAPYRSESNPEGDLYTSEGSNLFYRSFPPAGPIIFPQPCQVKAGFLGNDKATLLAKVNPEGKETKFLFEYVTEEDFAKEGFLKAAKTPETALPGSADFYLHEATFKVEGLKPETDYRCQVVAKNADAPAGVKGEEGKFKTKEGFEFGPTWASAVKEASATVNVEGNPLGIPATGQIEYVDDAKYQANGPGNRFNGAVSAPSGGKIEFGASETMQLRSVELSGLAPGTLYHYRLRAHNGTPPEGIICPEKKLVCPELEHTFRTYGAEAAEFDQRKDELVSPGEKNSAEVATPGSASGLFENEGTTRIQAATGPGEAITYTSWTSFGKAESAPATSQYLSRRGSAGWGTENISPGGIQNFALKPPFQGFSSDLGFGAVTVRQPAQTPDCPEGVEDLYLRDNSAGTLDCLTPVAPEIIGGATAFCFTYAGASADGSRAFFAARAFYPGIGASRGDESGSNYNLYEWSAAQGLKVVSVLPAAQGGAVAPATPGTAYGEGGGNCKFGQKSLRHVVSSDGSKAIWTYVPAKSTDPTQLLVRVGGSETVQLDKGLNSGNGLFWAASADGSVVYFTDANRLVPGSKSEPGAPDLYRYEFDQPTPLTDLTKASTTNTPADVQGVVGASDDGSYVYFVAQGVLSEEANASGEKAEEGKNNLYLFHAGKTCFVGILSGEDQNAWESQPKVKSARVSPDGRYLAFLSTQAEELAGYDSTIASGEHCKYEPASEKLGGSPLCPQAFVYDADDEDPDEVGTLSCVSCNPSGARPLGPTLFPTWTNPYEGPRYLANDGSRLSFESFDALVLADESQKRDVYEFERTGTGTCTTSNPNFDPAANGCHFLVSSGKSADETYLVDASASGRDVFFSIRDVLVGWDVNENYDVYDAREGGGFAEPTEPAICLGEASCKPPVKTPPSPPTPATPTFVGPGNAVQKPKPKKPKKKAHKKKQHKKKHGKAKQKRGARR